jgi:transposase
MTNYIGKDISKRDFHASFSEDTEVIKFNNDRKGIREFLCYLKQRKMRPGETIRGMESTGHYHFLPALMCTQAGYMVKVINPLITANANKKNLRRVKTDSADARLIRYCTVSGQGHIFRETEETLKLKTLVRQRNYLSDLRLRLKLRQQNMDYREECIKQSISSVNRDLHDILTVKFRELDKELRQYNKGLQNLLASIPGVGPQTAVSFLSEVGDITRFTDAKKLTAFIGLDSRVHQSGTSINGKGYISKRGNIILRTRLFNAATVATVHPPNIFSDFFQKKLSEGKPYRVALVATMHKMVHVIYAVWTRGTPFINKR